jgi:IclR family acetate operon transcriptional repressor
VRATHDGCHVVSVKRLRSASRVLSILEAIAEHQPIGVGALARLLDDDKSAVQRALMTLADDGWIRQAPGEPTRWELTTRIHVVANMAQGYTDLRDRARIGLDALRDETGESIILAVPDVGRLVVIDVLESRQLVRTAPYVGMVIPGATSAAGKAVLARMTPEARLAFLRGPVARELEADLETVLERGWALNDEDIVAGATSIGAAVTDSDGRPIAAIVISAPSVRLQAGEQTRLASRLVHTADTLSYASPARSANAPT